MKQLLNRVVMLIAYFHDRILRINDRFEVQFTDKELHFLVIGLIGMFLYLVIHPVFLSLAKRNRVETISWIYTFTLIVGLTFAIEIGQHISGTGNMEFADIVFGVAGFLLMFAVYAIFAILFKLLKRLISNV